MRRDGAGLGVLGRDSGYEGDRILEQAAFGVKASGGDP